MFDNNVDPSDADLPFCRTRYSVCGRELGGMGIREFVMKTLVCAHGTATPPI
jgi:hypothetical protein